MCNAVFTAIIGVMFYVFIAGSLTLHSEEFGRSKFCSRLNFKIQNVASVGQASVPLTALTRESKLIVYNVCKSELVIPMKYQFVKYVLFHMELTHAIGLDCYHTVIHGHGSCISYCNDSIIDKCMSNPLL